MPKLVMLKTEKVGLGLGTLYEKGEILASFCKVNELILTNTCFKHHKRNTWLSHHDGNTIKQIDYIAID